MVVLLSLLAGLAVLMFLPTITWAVVEGGARHRWRRVVESPERVGVRPLGAFRDASAHVVTATVMRARAPWMLHLAALSCWVLGQMAIPGFLLLCAGLMIARDLARNGDPALFALMVSFVPGCWCAWLIWKAGCALLNGVRAKADAATRRAAIVVVAYNVLLLAVVVLRRRAGHDDAFLPTTWRYAMLSIAHVLVVRAAYWWHRDDFPIADEQ